MLHSSLIDHHRFSSRTHPGRTHFEPSDTEASRRRPRAVRIFRSAFNSSECVKESGGRFGTGITGLALVFLAIFPPVIAKPFSGMTYAFAVLLYRNCFLTGNVRATELTQRAYRLASRRRMSMPRSKVVSSTEKLKRKWLSRLLNVLPGMMSRLLRIASVTNSVPVPQGAFGNM